MNESNFLNFLQPYLDGSIGIERFFEANSQKLDSSIQLETQTEYFALVRILYDYSLFMLDQAIFHCKLFFGLVLSISKPIIYFAFVPFKKFLF
jgi:hypothetical protein